MVRCSGIGVAWRPQIAGLLGDWAREGVLRFSEVVAENVDPARPAGDLSGLVDAGVTVVPHGVELGLAGAEPPSPPRVERLALLAERLNAPLVSEHVAFVRAGSDAHGPHTEVLEAGHLVPPPRTGEALDVLCANVRQAQAALPVPLALENVTGTLRWPEDEYDEPDYLTALVERTGCWLLLDVANLYGTCSIHGGGPAALLRRLPLERVAYVHVAGGEFRDGLYVDTHADAIHDAVLDLLREFVALTGPDRPAVLLERDENVVPEIVAAEFARVREAVG